MPLTDAARRFAQAMAELAPEWQDDGASLLIALSGGADSSALLWLAAQGFPGRVHAMTVDHGLRAEAADEARACAALCARLDVPHRIAWPETPITGNLQSQARAARYTLLAAEAERLGGALVATAHHAGDQLETILMRLARGSGVSGLAGIRARTGDIVRPLLGFTKMELIDICRAAGIEWIEDPSNRNPDFDRVRMREALAATDLPVEPKALARSAKALADAEDALVHAADMLSQTRISTNENGWMLDPHDLSHELLRRLVLDVLTQAEEAPPRGEALERAIAALHRGEKVSLGGLVASGGAIWSFAPAPPRRV